MQLDATKLRLEMIDKRFNVTRLSQAAGVSASSINLWLNHGQRPRLDNLGKVAGALGVPVTNIIKDN